MTVQPAPLTDEPGLNTVLAKTHALLRAFRDGHMTLRLTDLSQRSGVSKTSVYRLAEQLVELGMLARTEDGYQLGIAMFEFSRHVPMPAVLSTMARPILVDLATTIHGTVHISVLEHLDVLYVEKINGRQGFHLISGVGARLPINATASGRLLLAESPDRDAIIDRLVETGALPAEDVADLRRQIARAQDLSYGIEREEVSRGWKSLAVAVRDGIGEAIAALSAVVPASRPDEHQILQQLRSAAADISRRTRTAGLPLSSHSLPPAAASPHAAASGSAPSCRRLHR